MRILVCGGRTYGWMPGPRKVRNEDQYETFYGVMDDYLRDNELRIISGGAAGADTMAYEWSKLRQVPIFIYFAEWNTYDNTAGPIRNALMLKEGKPDLVLAFPGGKGTAHMVKISYAAGVKVRKIDV